MFLEFFLAIIAILFLSLYLHFKKNYNFWKDQNVPYLEPSFPTGNMIEAVKTKVHFGYVMEDIYKHMKMRSDVGDYCGIFFFQKPVLLVMTPEFAKTILVRDFNYFADRGLYSNEEIDPLSANLFFLEGQRWKNLRAKLTPTFTSGRLRQMFHTIFDVGEKFIEYLMPYGEKCEDIEIGDLLARFTTDVISSCAFGFESNALQNPNVDFRTMGKRMINLPKLKSLKVFLAMNFREKARKLGIRFNDEDVAEFFIKIVRETIDYRKNSGIKRKDFMELLIDLMEDDDDDEKLTFNEVAAQAFVFYFAGFETSSTALTYALYLLAYNRDIQDKARNVVNETLLKFNNKWTYDAVMDMPYLEQIIEETLRIYPPVATIHRIATQDYELPNGTVILKDTGVLIPNLAFQRDPDYFKDPLNFDPDRFSAENKSSIHQCANLSFGEGPRFCIGMRFGLLQTRMILGLLLKNFEFIPCLKTENPLKIDPIKLIHSPKDGVWLKITKV